MGYCKQSALPVAEPVTLTDAKLFLRLSSTYTDEDALITGMIQSAREVGEALTGRALAQRTFVQVFDRFPSNIYHAMQGDFASGGFGIYSAQWGYQGHRQMIELDYPPVVSVQSVQYVDSNGNVQTLHQDTDFILDRQTDFARLVPLYGTYWPITMITANSVQVNFTAGYDPNPTATDTHTVSSPNPPEQQASSTIVTGIPEVMVNAIKNLVAFWYQNRGLMTVPTAIHSMFQMYAAYRFTEKH